MASKGQQLQKYYKGYKPRYAARSLECLMMRLGDSFEGLDQTTAVFLRHTRIMTRPFAPHIFLKSSMLLNRT